MTSLDPITLIVPIHNGADRTEPALRAWSEFLQTELGREYDIIVVDDGSTDRTPSMLEDLAKSLPKVRVLKHETHCGFGASLRTALAEPTHPIVAYTSFDYPYTPSDCSKLLHKLDEDADVYGSSQTVEAVNGCRTGRPVPGFWKLVGFGYRLFCRIALGIPVPRLQGWLGFRDHARSWFLWLAMGVPMTDVNSAFKVFRRRLFDRFPIQSDGDFVHSEIFAKLTHLSVLVNEIPLTPKPEAGPPTWWHDFWKVFKDAKFHTTLPDLTQPQPAPTA